MTNTDKFVAVEIRTFSHGMKSMFQGVAEIFASMGLAAPEDMTEQGDKWIPNGMEGDEKNENTETGSVPAVGNASPAGALYPDDRKGGVATEAAEASGSAEVSEDAENLENAETGDTEVEAGTDSASGKKSTRKSVRKKAGKDAEAPAEKAEDKAAEASAGAAGVPGVTQDDITKIIVQKIKQNRSNNERIGQLLKTYGVSKVSELPSGKYEAFITDLAAI